MRKYRDMERYEKATRMRGEGATLKRIGLELMVTPERIRQMLLWMQRHGERYNQKMRGKE